MESSDGPECFQVTSLSKSFKEWSIKTGLFPFLVHAMVTKKLVFSTAYFLSCSTSKVNNMVNGYLGPDDYRIYRIKVSILVSVLIQMSFRISFRTWYLYFFNNPND